MSSLNLSLVCPYNPVMKKTLFQLLLLLISISALQPLKAQVVEYTAMPDRGISLDSGWRFSPADQPAFAQPGLKDSAWSPISPRALLADLPELKKVKIGWLRLHLRVSDSLANQTLLLSIRQNCASEIYLDGKLLKRCGTLSATPSGVVAKNLISPLEIRFIPGREHVIAVRFAPLPAAFIYQNTATLMEPTLMGLPQSSAREDNFERSVFLYGSLFTLFALLSLLHISFYRYNPEQRANLFFALYTGLSAIEFLAVTWQGKIENATFYLFIDTFVNAIPFIGGIWMVKALLTLFNFRHPKMVAILWVIGVTGMILGTFLRREFGIVIFLVSVIVFALIQLWLPAKALKKKKRGAGIIASGFAVSLVATLLLAFTFIFRWVLGEAGSIIVIFSVFAAPGISISLYLAREFALDSRMLQQKLRQVEELSTQSLRQEQEKQELLARQNDELENQVAARTSELRSSLTDLKATQHQLIQSEKMASLGELTAGIAHEIQNPLNFVNNFSEVSSELVQELRQEAETGNTSEVIALAGDLDENLKKITHHGKRADAIVKGMLQHSRTGTGKKEPTDINALADEYLRLSYHGLRARDKSFNAGFHTDFDASIGKIEIVPQDMGRVLLNLLNNAFYAVMQKKKVMNEGSYEPSVTVSTKKLDGKAVITIRDNGTGIPQKVLDKIYQPFFTTKPTGEGTGLGLSLSYDIVTKGHGGELKVESRENEFTEFIISLPL
jgi:two-component system, NtrC family, sensor kinase